MNVLLVEPDQVLARVYQTALRRDGHAVQQVVSAQAAVQAADAHMPDVVVLELQLPRHNGVEFLYEFRSYSEWLHIPIVIHSYVRERDLAAAATLRRELGVRAVLPKSLTTLEQLRAAVNHVQPVVS